MEEDTEVLSHLFNSMGDLVRKLEFAANNNKVEETARIKKEVLGIQKKIDVELK
jgi:hypothetical protein